ncbi:MAG: S9 family peptidase [Bacteroidota bacterium]
MKSTPFLTVVLFLLLGSSSAFSQEPSVKPNENLILDGVPAIPMSIAEATGRYTEFRSAGLLSWHPVKREMLIGTRFGDVPQIHLVTAPGGARKQLTFYAERVGGGRFEPVHGNYFVFSKDIGGGEWYQNYRYDMATGDVTMLTDGKSRNSLGIWARDGSRMAYTSTRRNGKDNDIYTIQPADTSSNKLLVQVEGGGWSPITWSPDGKTILVGEYVSANESYFWLVDARSGEKSLLTPKEGTEQIAYGTGRFSKDGKGIYLTTDRESEFTRLAYMDLSTKRVTYLTSHISWDVDEVELSPDGMTIAFVTNEDGVGTLHFMNTRTRNALPAPKLPNGIVSDIEWHHGGKYIAFEISSAKSPADVYSLEVKSGKVERWTMSETGGLNTERFPDAKLIKWKTFDDKMISGFLYRPPARFTGKRPVIVNIHGGPEGQFRPGFLGRNNYYLNELGVVVIFPNVRGSSGYGKTFLKLDNGFLREGSYKDIAALFDWIKQQTDLDGDRIMVTGGSYGGHATLAVSTFYSDKIRCSVDVVGMSNLVTFLEHTESYRRDLRRVEYGDERESKMREFLEKIAPMNHVELIKKPMFVIQGKNDPRVPYTESEQIVGALKKINTPVWYLLATDEGHGYSKKKNQDFQFYASVIFIKEFLMK